MSTPSSRFRKTLPSVNLLLRRECKVTIALLGLLFGVITLEYGYAYATTVVTVILALSVEVGLFLSALIFVREAVLGVVNWRAHIQVGVFAAVMAFLYVVRPSSVSITIPYAAVVAGVVFVVLFVFGRRTI